MKNYYYLLEKIDGDWHVSFGDYDLETVKDEAETIDNKTKIVTAVENANIHSIIEEVK